MTTTPNLKLGLIGDNIKQSLSPRLHRLAGAQHGLKVQYDRLIPKELGTDFDALFLHCQKVGYRGINVTYPYKEKVAAKVTVNDPLVRSIGAINTVLFNDDGPVGHNTDFSGFVAGYRGARGDAGPGIACLIGTGGVGRALAFGLVALGAQEIRLVDRYVAKAKLLAEDLRALENAPLISVFSDPAEAAEGATGLLNGTPVGMVGIEGVPLPATSMKGAKWAFDAVYTPPDTQFLKIATTFGLKPISGYELFFYQGVYAWAHFSGLPLDEARLRQDLMQQGQAA